MSFAGARGASIAVIGGAGTTGRFVIGELERRGFEPIVVGREGAAMTRLVGEVPSRSCRYADLADPRSLDAALAGASAVINCAGPFLDTAVPVIDAALRSQIHYIDVAPEQAAARTAFDLYPRQALEAGIAILPSFAFYGGLADLLASAAMTGWAQADSICVAVALDSWKPTVGTRLTGQRNSGPRYILKDGELRPVASPPEQRAWTFPGAFGRQDMIQTPLAEVITIAHHLDVASIDAFMNEAPLLDLRNSATPPPEPADASGRSDQIFTMDVKVTRGSETRRATAFGRDIYATSAPMVVEAAARLLDPWFGRSGVFAPAEIFDPAEFLATLSDDMFSVSFEDRE